MYYNMYSTALKKSSKSNNSFLGIDGTWQENTGQHKKNGFPTNKN